MKPKKVFKRYDVRGEYPEEVDEKFSELLGKSFGTFIIGKNQRKAVVVRDNKDSSKDLKKSFINGLNSVGVSALDGGVGPTDYAAFTGKNSECFSVQVTSSHMPANFNGFKFMYPEGNGLLNPDLNAVKDIFLNRNFFQKPKRDEITNTNIKSLKTYKESVRDFVESNFEVHKKKIVLDTLGGATEPVLKPILEELGHEVIDIGEVKNYDSSPYRDPPNPKPKYLEELKQIKHEEGADIGFSSDMDGDRATVYYEDRFLSGNEVFGILANLLKDNAVGSIDTSHIVEDVIERNGFEIHYTRVGDPFVLDKALEEDVNLAGEPNGHYSFLDFVPYNSGTLAICILASIKLKEHLDALKHTEHIQKSLKVKNKNKVINKIIKQAKENYKVISELDGVKFTSNSNVSVLVRPSGSSSKIRIIAEGRNSKDVEDIVENISEWVK